MKTTNYTRTLIATSLVFGAYAFASAQGEIRGMIETTKGDRIHLAVLSLTSVPGGHATAPKTVQMDQLNKEFDPKVIAIEKGTTVNFQNSDPFFHNVFSSSRTKTFNVSQTKKGDVSSITFDKVGVVSIRCHIHANMKGYIVVLPNAYFDVSNEKGLFRIKNVPAGTYTIKAWGAGFEAQEQTVTVPASGDAKVIFKIAQ